MYRDENSFRFTKYVTVQEREVAMKRKEGDSDSVMYDLPFSEE